MEEFRIPVEIIDPSGKLQTLITYTKMFCYVLKSNRYQNIIANLKLFYFSGSKTTLYEGGVRVPAFIYGPQRYFPKSFDNRGLFHISDFYPTILQLIGKQNILTNKPHATMDGVGQFLVLNGSSTINLRKNVHIHRFLWIDKEYKSIFDVLILFDVRVEIESISGILLTIRMHIDVETGSW